jgi:hypothetical protein
MGRIAVEHAPADVATVDGTERAAVCARVCIVAEHRDLVAGNGVNALDDRAAGLPRVGNRNDVAGAHASPTHNKQVIARFERRAHALALHDDSE